MPRRLHNKDAVHAAEETSAEMRPAWTKGESELSPQFEKLKALLQELFQLDQPDLDFGIYRIMRAKGAEVSAFLERDLLPQVEAAFAQYQAEDRSESEKELSRAIKQAQELGADPETLPKVLELRARIASGGQGSSALEGEVYDHLYSFFRRYYSDGDFLSKRVYKTGVYAIPYQGEEVKLHWANADQYYIKTSEYLRDYTFRLRPDDESDPMRVHFRLVDAAEGEHGNVKEADEKRRVFILTAQDFIAKEEGESGPELVIRFEYRAATPADWGDQAVGKSKPPAQRDLIAMAEQTILAVTEATLAPWIESLGKSYIKATGDQADHSRLRAQLNRYTARNTFDYFIHKDLGGFLRRELDFYIKNEVMHLDDVENEGAVRVEQYISKIKVLRQVAHKIIDFLAQLEDFQKKLWLKKKFVMETSWCIRVGCIPKQFYSEIISNDAQRREWVHLLAINEMSGNRTTPGYSAPLTPDFLETYPTLMVDTRHFDNGFTARVLEGISDLDEQTDGVLFHSENFQALALLRARYKESIDCVYIDPPYNTGDSEILYKNTYLKSSWLTLMANRLAQTTRLLTSDPVFFLAIDDFEMVDLSKLIDSEFPSLRREIIIVNHHPQGGKAKTIAHTHEYMLACVSVSSDRSFNGRMSDEGIEERPFRRSGTAESNFRSGRPNSFYALLVDPTSQQVVGSEAPPIASDYPMGPTPEGYYRIYPIGAQGEERVWRRSFESCLELIGDGKLRWTGGNTVYQLIDATDRKSALFSNWVDPRYNAGTHGANLLRDIIGTQNAFSYPKSIHTVEDAIFSAGLDDGAVLLDYFAGSGTTGHAAINLNREDGGRRKFILVEMADYFDTVLLQRLKKVTFSPEWSGGKPSRVASEQEVYRGPKIMKVVRLESYEDALNNIKLARTASQQAMLDALNEERVGGFREQYMLRYMLDVETRGSASLLDMTAFTDPTAYRLKVKRPGSDESYEMNVDLLETFDWLVGLTVQHLAVPHTVDATFERDGEGRLHLSGELKKGAGGAWWFRTVTGTTPDGRTTLVIWRKRPGGETIEGIEQDNLVLNEWFATQGYLSKAHQFDLIYVNGDNNLESLRSSDDTWRVRLIEEDFHRLMFATEAG